MHVCLCVINRWTRIDTISNINIHRILWKGKKDFSLTKICSFVLQTIFLVVCLCGLFGVHCCLPFSSCLNTLYENIIVDNYIYGVFFFSVEWFLSFSIHLAWVIWFCTRNGEKFCRTHCLIAAHTVTRIHHYVMGSFEKIVCMRSWNNFNWNILRLFIYCPMTMNLIDCMLFKHDVQYFQILYACQPFKFKCRCWISYY